MEQLAPFLVLCFLFMVPTTNASPPNPNILGSGMVRQRSTALSESNTELPTLYYAQTLDHFNYKPDSYQTFQQRYFLNDTSWGGANSNSPIFAYLGAEGDVTLNIGGFVNDLAARFHGLLLYMEHRYYGESIPFGRETNQDATTLGYLSSMQALADYAQLILDVKKNLSAENCPVIAIGGSYGGMLASWFRLKYPHIVIGALASSAPILYFEDIIPQVAFYDVVSWDFRNTSESCYNDIKESWDEIDSVANKTNGLLILQKIFNLTKVPSSSNELKANLATTYIELAQYEKPIKSKLERFCRAIDGVPEGTCILTRIAEGLKAINYSNLLQIHNNPQQTWSWQTCTEIVIPIGVDNNNTMFYEFPFDPNNFTTDCQMKFCITPRLHWITTEYGGHNIKSVLENFGSNIIFSNGLRDPYSAGGVLESISDSIVAIKTERGSHCLDLDTPTSDDPDWLVALRDEEINIIAQWISSNTKLKEDNGNAYALYI